MGTAVPRLVKFAGTLKDELGKARTGVVGVTFAIYKDQEGGAALWLETQNVELDEQGHYTVLLGATKNEGLPLELFAAGEPRWLGVQVNLPKEVEQPRVLLVSVPYALKAADAETLGGKPLSSFVLAPPPSGGVVGVGTALNPAGTAATAAATIGGGGTQNFVTKFDATGANVVNSSLFDNGLVGIGTTNPQASLDVQLTTGSPTNALNSTITLNNSSPITGGVLSAFKMTLVDASTAANLSKQPARFVYLRDASATGGVTAFDSVMTATSFLSADAPYQLRGINIEGPTMATGKTLGNFTGLYIGSPGGSGAVSNKFALVTEANAGNVGLGTTAPTQKLEVAGKVKVSGAGNGIMSGNVQITAPGKGIVVQSPDGTKCRQIGIDNTGSRVMTAVPCPNQPRCAYVANQLSNNVSAYTVDPATGKLGAVAGSPFGDVFGSVSVAADPSGRFLYVANNGAPLVDVSAFVIDASTCALMKVPGSPFSTGSVLVPSAVAVHPSGNFLYETSLTGAVACFTINRATGALSQCSNPPAPAGTLTNSIALHPSGRFAYVTNQGSDNVSGYSIDSTSGNLTPIPGSPFPVDCRLSGSCLPFAVALDPLEKFAYVANADATISSYNIDAPTGKLAFTSMSPFVESNPNVGAFSWVTVNTSGNFALAAGTGGFVAVCQIDRSTGDCKEIPSSPFVAGAGTSSIAVDPADSFVYATNQTSSSISCYAINSSTGVLTPFDCGVFQTGAQPVSIVVAAPAP